MHKITYQVWLKQLCSLTLWDDLELEARYEMDNMQTLHKGWNLILLIFSAEWHLLHSISAPVQLHGSLHVTGWFCGGSQNPAGSPHHVHLFEERVDLCRLGLHGVCVTCCQSCNACFCFSYQRRQGANVARVLSQMILEVKLTFGVVVSGFNPQHRTQVLQSVQYCFLKHLLMPTFFVC